MGARKFSKNAREPKEKEQKEGEITEHEKKVMLNANFPRRGEQSSEGARIKGARLPATFATDCGHRVRSLHAYLPIFPSSAAFFSFPLRSPKFPLHSLLRRRRSRSSRVHSRDIGPNCPPCLEARKCRMRLGQHRPRSIKVTAQPIPFSSRSVSGELTHDPVKL